MAKITKQQYEELAFACSFDEQRFAEMLEEYTGITRKAYTSYDYYCGGDYVGGSENHTLADILRNAYVEVKKDGN